MRKSADIPSNQRLIFTKEVTRFSMIVTVHCGNYRKLLSRFFGNNFVKVTVLLKKLLNS